MSNRPIVGLTGGIASGKSVVAKVLRDLGVAVVDADQLARDVVAPGTEGLAEVVAQFGPAVLRADGSLDREKLASIVFADPDKRKRLNAITHPRIGALGMQRIAELQHTATPYVVYEAPLLVEVGGHKGMAAVIVVGADSETQVRRVTERDGSSPEQARARIDAQLPLADKIAVADYVIANEGTLEELRARTLEVHAAILERFALTNG